MGHLHDSTYPGWPSDQGRSLGFSRLWDCIYLVSNSCYSAIEVDFEGHWSNQTPHLSNLSLAQCAAVCSAALVQQPPWSRVNIIVRTCQILSNTACPYNHNLERPSKCHHQQPPRRGVILHVAVLELKTLALMPFLAAAEKDALKYKCNSLLRNHGGCGVLVPLPGGIFHIDHHGFILLISDALFATGWAALGIDGRPIWIGHLQVHLIAGFLKFSVFSVHVIKWANISLQSGDTSGELGLPHVFAAREVALAIYASERCCVSNAVA